MTDITNSDLKHQASHPEFVVGIGASAGGLEAIEELFENMPLHTGIAFVIIQHLSPDHKSLMHELLARKTKIPIVVASNDTSMKPDHIYLLPPKKEMILSENRLLLQEREHAPTLTFPINKFFYSLADSYQNKAIAIVLSGTGSDGTKGIVSVHDVGGLTIAQEPSTCKFDSMPKNALATNQIDIQLAPQKIPEALLRFMNKTTKIQRQIDLGDMDVDENRFAEIILILKNRFGLDFSQYKPSTITRRLERRLTIQKTSSMQEYLNILLANPEELENLYFDLLIGVTEFFRDPNYFEILKRSLDDIYDKFKDDEEIRVWVAGCATGQEAYSVSILLNEYNKKHNIDKKYRIFATDIHKRSITKATTGTYAEREMVGLSRQQISEYFTKNGSVYQAVPKIRKTIVFAQHNLIRDPPFTKTHLVCCRNLLIYLNQRTQKRILGLLGFSLKTGGYLFLGPSETISSLTHHFEVIDESSKIFKKIRDTGRTPFLEYVSLPNVDDFVRRNEANTSFGHTTISTLPHMSDLDSSVKAKKALEILLQEHAPPCLLTDSEGNILRVFGNAKDFLRLEIGQPSLNIRTMVGHQAKNAISQMITHVSKYIKPVRTSGIEGFQGKNRVDIEVRPLSESSSDLGYLLIKFFDQTPKLVTGPIDCEIRVIDPIATQSNVTSNQIIELEEELRYTKESLQTTVEELETSNEELQASNEELQASNEELQSTNEELQSLNEELYTVNAEYQAKEKERAELVTDEKNILDITQVGVLLLDEKLRIRKFSPIAAKIFDILEGDEGRPFKAMSMLKSKTLMYWIKCALEKGQHFEEELTTLDGEAYAVKISPYERHMNSAKGVLETERRGVTLSFADISAKHALQENLDSTHKRYQSVLNSISDGFFDWQADNNLFIQNKLREQLGYDASEILSWDILLDGDSSEFLNVLLTPNLVSSFVFPVRLRKKDRSTVWMLAKGSVNNGKATGIFVNISSLKEKEANLDQNTIELQRSNKLLEEFAYIVSHDLKAPLRHIRNYLNFLDEAITSNNTDSIKAEMTNLDVSSRRLEALVDDIITLSRFSLDKKKHESVDLNLILDDVLKTHSPVIREKHVSVKADKLPTINGDRALLEHLFQNIIGNACKYNDKKKPSIKISTEKLPGYSVISFKDNGIGFSDRLSDLIFTPFKRLVTQEEYEGSGIGLAICKTVAEQHQGTISAKGQPGVGATITVKFKDQDAR